MRIRKRLNRDLLTYFFVVAIAVGGAALWRNNHRHKVEEQKADRVRSLAERERIKSAIQALKRTWKADDAWEREFSLPGVTPPAYSLDVQRALVRTHPILIFGTVDDVLSGKDHNEDLVLIENEINSNKVNLRFSLSSSPELAQFIASQSRSDELAQLDTFICVANIQSVEKVEGSPSQEGEVISDD
jgi:hypothetical protein